MTTKRFTWAELAALLILLAAAIFLRLWQLDTVPPGFQFDEAIDVKISLDIANGARPLYVAEGWGREGLFYYLAALVLQIVPFNPLAIRVTAVLWGLGLLIISYLLVRRWHTPLAAWLTVAWLTFTYWPLSTTRFGFRHMSLAFMMTLTAWVLWQGWGNSAMGNGNADDRDRDGFLQTKSKHLWLHFAATGFCLGLTLYTYQPSRFMPFIFAAFAVYLFLFQRKLAWANGRLWLTTLLTFTLTAVPLILALRQAGSLETAQRGFTIEPLTQLLAGNVQPILSNTWATFKAFTVAGDPLKSYNLPGRPIFVPAWTGIFFYAGLLLALKRWRNPIYAFVLLWLGVALLPTIITISAPNFNRMAAAQLPVMFLAAFPLAELGQWLEAGWRNQNRTRTNADERGFSLILAVKRRKNQAKSGESASQNSFSDKPLMMRQPRWGQLATALLIAATFVPLTLATWRDYFTEWPAATADVHTLNREIFAVANYLQQQPDSRPVLISSRDIADEDPYIVAVTVERGEMVRRWVDSSQALALPANVDEARLIVTADRWIDQTLLQVTGMSGTPIDQGAGFTVFALRRGDWLVAEPLALGTLGAETAVPTPDTIHPITWGYPLAICACSLGEMGNPSLLLTGVSLNTPVAAGQPVELLTTWQAAVDHDFSSLALFAHLLNEAGEIVAQYDGLGYPPHTWERGDQFLQLARLFPPADLPADSYWLQFGLYNRTTGQRWLLLDPTNRAIADRLLLPPLQAQDEQLVWAR